MEPKMNRFMVALFLFLAAPAAECFIVGSFGRPRSGCDVNRPLRGVQQQRCHHVLSRAPVTPSRGARSNVAALSMALLIQEGEFEGRRASVMSPSRLRQGVRLFAMEDGEMEGEEEDDDFVEGEEELKGEEEDDGEGYAEGEEGEELDGDEEEEYVEGVEGLEGEEDDEGEYEEEEGKGEEEDAEEEEDDKEPFVLTSEYQACTGDHDFFGDLIPVQDYDFSVSPDDAIYSAAELRGSIGSPENPFDFTSFYVDREIEMGVVDEKMEAAIQPMMGVIEQVCELIDTTDSVFSFKYTGLIRNKRGIEAWAKSLIEPLYPDVRDVVLVTNRTRDRRDH